MKVVENLGGNDHEILKFNILYSQISVLHFERDDLNKQRKKSEKNSISGIPK